MKKSPAAPPAYRPLPQPKVLQRKTAKKTAPSVVPSVKRGGESIQRAITNPFQMPDLFGGGGVIGGPGSLFANPPAPLRGVRVGDVGAGANFLAATNWTDDTAYQRALVILRRLQQSGAGFGSVGEIVAYVNADSQVARAVAAAAERARVVGNLTGGVSVRVSDIQGGTWRPIPGRSNGDHELVVSLNGSTYSLHVHPPRFNGGAGIPGEVMRGGRMTGSQTPQPICDEIVRIKGRPGGW